MNVAVTLSPRDDDEAKEGVSEALCVLGNGYFAACGSTAGTDT